MLLTKLNDHIYNCTGIPSARDDTAKYIRVRRELHETGISDALVAVYVNCADESIMEVEYTSALPHLIHLEGKYGKLLLDDILPSAYDPKTLVSIIIHVNPAMNDVRLKIVE